MAQSDVVEKRNQINFNIKSIRYFCNNQEAEIVKKKETARQKDLTFRNLSSYIWDGHKITP
jgi:hypothetical protein